MTPLLLPLLPLAIAATPAERLAEARAAERAGDVVTEHEVCAALLAEAPASPEATRCARRLSWLDARATPDGSLQALATLMAARRSPEGAREAVQGLARREDLPPALAADVHAWLAGDSLAQGAPAQALADAEQALRLDPDHDAARRQRARALAELGRWEEAEATEAAGPTRSARPREGVTLLAGEVRRARLRQASWVALLAFCLPGLPLARRGWAQVGGLQAAGLLPLSVAVGGSALLAGAWDLDMGLALAACLPSLTGVHLLSAGAGAALRSRPARALLGLSAALASLGCVTLTLSALGALPQVLP